MTEAQTEDVIRFTDHAAVRAFEYGFDHADVIQALRTSHFKQPALQTGRFVHYIRLEGRPIKVVTGPNWTEPGTLAVITLMPLEVELT